MTSLTMEGVSFAYAGRPSVFEDRHFRFDGGTVTAITGASGRGKSTFLYLLGLMLRPTRGAIVIDWQAASALTDRDRADLRAHAYGFVFQDAALDTNRTVLDNIVEGALYRGDDLRSAAREAHSLMEQFGVDVPHHSRPGEISGGQAQRIALARALLHRPRFVLADEPTGNLDSASAGIVLKALRERAQRGAAVVVVTHDPSVVQQCDLEVEL